MCLPESIRVTEEINGAKSAVIVEATTEARGSGLEERIRERLETKQRTSRDRSGLKSRAGDTEIDLSDNNDAGGRRDNDSEEDDEVDEISKARRHRQSERDRLTEGIIKSRRAVKVLLGETADKVVIVLSSLQLKISVHLMNDSGGGRHCVS